MKIILFIVACVGIAVGGWALGRQQEKNRFDVPIKEQWEILRRQAAASLIPLDGKKQDGSPFTEQDKKDAAERRKAAEKNLNDKVAETLKAHGCESCSLQFDVPQMTMRIVNTPPMGTTQTPAK